MNPVERAYGLLLELVRPLLPLARSLPPKVADAIEGRRRALGVARAWAVSGRQPDRPLLWLHAASAGELSGAVPVIRLLRERRPELQLAITVSSPSGLALARTVEADFAGFAPLDSDRDCSQMITLLRPDALVFVKLDVWPGLSRAASDAQVPLGMINGTVRPDSSRLRSPTRQFLRTTYARLDAAGVVGQPDVEALKLLGVDPERIRVTGDSACDQALARLDAARRSGRSLLPPASADRPRLVGGSTWPPDEDVLLETAHDIGAGFELVLVPHEPSPEAVGRIREVCRRLWGSEPVLWSELSEEGTAADRRFDGPVPIVVDAVGMLAELYLEADLALVGGAFDATGLHSVIEPAAAGLPVLFGPLYDRREAHDLLARDAAIAIAAVDASDRIRALLNDPARMEAMGRAARAYVAEGAGSAASNAEMANALIDLGLSRRRPGSA